MAERPTARGGGDVTGDATQTDSTDASETDDDLPEFEDDELRFDEDVAAGPPRESDFVERETEQAPEPVPETAERRGDRLQAPGGRSGQPTAGAGPRDRGGAERPQRGRDAAAAGAGATGQAGPPGREREASAAAERAADIPRREDALLPPREGGVEPEPVSRDVGREPPAEIPEGPPGAPELDVEAGEEATAEVGAEATTVAEEVAAEFEPFVVEAATSTITSGASIRQQQLRNRRRIREGDFGFDLVGEIRDTAEEIEQTLFGGAREDFEEFEETFFEPVQEAAPTTADIREGAFTFAEFALETSVGDENIFTFQFEEGEEPETADLTVFTGPGPVAAFGGTSAVSSARGFIQAARGTRAAKAARIGRTATTGPVGGGGGGGGFGLARGFPALNLGRDAQIGSGLLGLMAGAAIVRERGIPEDAEPTGPEGIEAPENAEPTGPEGFDVPEGVEPVAPVEFESPAEAGDVFGPEVGVPEDAEPVTATELDVPDRDRDTLEIGAAPILAGEELEEDEKEDELGVPDDPFRRSDERLFDPAREFEEFEQPLADVDPTEPGPGEAAEDIAEGLAGVGAPEVAGEEDVTFAENMERAVEEALERQERAQQVDVLQDDDVAGEEEDLDVVAEMMERLEQAARARLDEDLAADELLAPDERAGELFGTGVDEAQLPREDQSPDLDVPERLGDRLRFDPDLAETPGQGQADDFLEPPENPPEFDFPEVTPTSTGAPFEPVNPTETITEDAPGLGLFEPVTQQFGEEPVDLLDLPEPRDEEEEFFEPVGTLDLFANPVLTGAELFGFGVDDAVDDTSE